MPCNFFLLSIKFNQPKYTSIEANFSECFSFQTHLLPTLILAIIYLLLREKKNFCSDCICNETAGFQISVLHKQAPGQFLKESCLFNGIIS